MVSASELVEERAKLLVRLGKINEALEMLGNPGQPVEISTRRNLRNTYLLDVQVYSDESLTALADEAAHSGYITAEDAAYLRTEGRMIDDDCFSIMD
jgi:hypothetical protein